MGEAEGDEDGFGDFACDVEVIGVLEVTDGGAGFRATKAVNRPWVKPTVGKFVLDDADEVGRCRAISLAAVDFFAGERCGRESERKASEQGAAGKQGVGH